MSFFHLDELVCKDAARTPYPAVWRETRWPELRDTCNVVRAAYGRALLVVSGYRTPDYNRAVGGASSSQHVAGRAVDLRPARMPPLDAWQLVDFQEIDRLHQLTLRLHAEGKLPALGGLGVYARWIHIDTRPDRRGANIARWDARPAAMIASMAMPHLRGQSRTLQDLENERTLDAVPPDGIYDMDLLVCRPQQ